MNLDTDATHFTELNFTWITYVKVQCKTIKLLEDNIGENLNDPGYGDDFLDTTPKAQSMKEIIDMLDFIKINNFHSAQDPVKRTKRQATDCGKIFICKRHIW